LYTIGLHSNIIPSFKIERERQHDIVPLLATKVYPTIESNKGILANYDEQIHKYSTCGLTLKACARMHNKFEWRKQNKCGW